MTEYEIVKIGKTHFLGEDYISQDVIEIYPLDTFKYNWDFAVEIYNYIQGVDNRLTGAFPICKFVDGVYNGVVGVLGILRDSNGKDTVGLSIDKESLELADSYCSAAYSDNNEVQTWAKLMQVVDDCDILNEVVDFVHNRIFEGCDE